MKYTRKPEIIEAWRFDGSLFYSKELPDDIRSHPKIRLDGGNHLLVPLNDGMGNVRAAAIGEMIVRRADGRIVVLTQKELAEDYDIIVPEEKEIKSKFKHKLRPVWFINVYTNSDVEPDKYGRWMRTAMIGGTTMDDPQQVIGHIVMNLPDRPIPSLVSKYGVKLVSLDRNNFGGDCWYYSNDLEALKVTVKEVWEEFVNRILK